MKPFHTPLFLVLLAIATPTPSHAAESSERDHPGGHWEGAIKLPNTELGIRVDLEKTGAHWKGTIDIPVQGLRGFELGDIEYSDRSVIFKMPGIPGAPGFNGKFASNGQTITGKFSQAGQTYDFEIKRAEKKLEKGATPAKGIPGEGFAGVWQGSLKVSLFELRLLFKLKDGNDGLSGTMDSLDQNALDIPITGTSTEGRQIELQIRSIGGVFDGELSDDGSEIKGEWKQGGQTFPLVLKRLEKAPDLSRPQDPVRPYPYNEEDVVFHNESADINLAGTFTFPKSKGPHPAAILLTGSGPQDRNESIMGHRPFLVLADHLTRQGIAVLRYDDRGFGKSEGNHGQAVNADFVTDALAAVDYLKTRSEVDPERIGLIGHSEGGITAPRAAAQSEDVAYIVLLAGVGVPMDQLLRRQGEDILRVMGADQASIDKQLNIQKEAFRILREQGPTEESREAVRKMAWDSLSEYNEEELEAMGFSEAAFESQFQMIFSPWFADIIDYDPREVLEKVPCPVLAINGSRDVQVASRENLSAIENALKAGGNDDVTIVEFPNLNHLFQTSETGAIAEYGSIEETLNPEVLNAISNWVRVKMGL